MSLQPHALCVRNEGVSKQFTQRVNDGAPRGICFEFFNCLFKVLLPRGRIFRSENTALSQSVKNRREKKNP